MVLGAPLGRFPLGVIADLNDGILDATEDRDVAEFVGAIAALSGYLDGTEAPDTAEFAGLRSEEGTLDATEAPDTAEMHGRAWAVFGEACQGKTVCVTYINRTTMMTILPGGCAYKTAAPWLADAKARVVRESTKLPIRD